MRRFREKTKDEQLRFAKMLGELKVYGITQGDFARAIGITQPFVSRLKTGNATMSVSLAKKIERSFPEYLAAWLLGLDERQASNPVSKVEALKVLDPMVSTLSPERMEELLDYVQEFIKFELRK